LSGAWLILQRKYVVNLGTGTAKKGYKYAGKGVKKAYKYASK
jgi:hypothetical protein